MVLHAGERHRHEVTVDGPRCPDCDRVLRPYDRRSVCPGCGTLFLGGRQWQYLVVETFTPSVPAGPPKVARPGRMAHRARDGQLTIFGGEHVEYGPEDVCDWCRREWQAHNADQRDSCRRRHEQPGSV